MKKDLLLFSISTNRLFQSLNPAAHLVAFHDRVAIVADVARPKDAVGEFTIDSRLDVA